MQTLPSPTLAAIRHVRRIHLSDLPALFGKWIEPSLARLKSARNRLFTPPRIFWTFLGQVLAGNCSCKESLSAMLARLYSEEEKTASSNTGGYCKARGRLNRRWVERLHPTIVSVLEAQAGDQGLWQGRTVKIVDGSSVSMPDTEANQKRYPQPSGQKKGCGFPVLRLTALFSLATGAIVAFDYDALRVHERTLFRRLWNHFQAGDVALTDRGFISFADIALLLERGVDSVMRKNARLSTSLRTIKRLGRGDHLVAWKKSSVRPKWLKRNEWESLPDEMTVRQITVHVTIPGFRSRTIEIITTLLDPKAFPKRAFADLYRKRWLAELFLRDVKTSMGMDVLKCKTPQMVRKELRMYLIAYNLIRALMFEAAAQSDTPPLRISFKETADTLRQWAPLLAQAARTSDQKLDNMTDVLLSYIAQNVVPHRPNRVEPRARKRRPKNYPLLNKPRSEYQEIYHRNRYRAGAKA